MRGPALLAALLLCGAAAPDWAADAVGSYSGRILSGPAMQCAHTVFTLENGELVGTYHVDGKDPYDGTLDAFKPDGPGSPRSGIFTWTDKFGRGVEWLSFAADGTAYAGAWGLTEPLAGHASWGTRRPVPGCDVPPTS